MKGKAGYLFLVTGLALGIGIGLLIAWGLAPAQYVDTTPASLRTDFKDDYRYMIASAYTASGDLPRAQARLAALGESDSAKTLGAQAQRMLAENIPMDRIRVLANLSEAIQTQPTASAAPAFPPTASPMPVEASSEAAASPTTKPPTEPVETATSEPTATSELDDTPAAPLPTAIFTATPHPTRTPTPTPGVPFVLANQSTFCEPTQPGLLQIYLVDEAFKPVAGAELVITWFGGEEHFFTGLKPEIGFGYADYQMAENTEYALSLSGGGTRVTGLKAPPCTDSNGKTYPGGIRLEFKQP
jgi:hypothetical protein